MVVEGREVECTEGEDVWARCTEVEDLCFRCTEVECVEVECKEWCLSSSITLPAAPRTTSRKTAEPAEKGVCIAVAVCSTKRQRLKATEKSSNHWRAGDCKAAARTMSTGLWFRSVYSLLDPAMNL